MSKPHEGKKHNFLVSEGSKSGPSLQGVCFSTKAEHLKKAISKPVSGFEIPYRVRLVKNTHAAALREKSDAFSQEMMYVSSTR